MKSFDESRAWKQVCERDGSARFFYAVATTGVFCRPDCKSRRPLRANVRFFGRRSGAGCGVSRLQALQANCVAQTFGKIRAYLEANLDRAVSLAELGRITGMSPFTVQRISSRRWA